MPKMDDICQQAYVFQLVWKLDGDVMLGQRCMLGQRFILRSTLPEDMRSRGGDLENPIVLTHRSLIDNKKGTLLTPYIVRGLLGCEAQKQNCESCVQNGQYLWSARVFQPKTSSRVVMHSFQLVMLFFLACFLYIFLTKIIAKNI